MGLEITDGHRVFLATLPVGRGERRLTLTPRFRSPAP
jgi:hypothetical protein